MTFSHIDSVEQVLIRFVVKVRSERLLVEMLGTRPKDLISANRRLMRLPFDYRLAFFLRWWREVGVSVQVVFLEPDRLTLHSLNFLEIFFVI
jgi:hypothetical protein